MRPGGLPTQQCAEWKARAVWPEWWPKTPSACRPALMRLIGKWVARPCARRAGAGGAPTRQHGAPCTVVGGWLPASRGGEQAPALLHLHRTVAGRRTGAQAAAMARRHMQERHAPKAVGPSRAVAAQVAAQGRAAAAAQAACCQAACRLTTRSSSAASGGLEAHQPSAAAAGQPRHLPHSLLGGLQILGQRRQLPLAGLPSDELHASKASGGNQSSKLFRPRKAPT